MVKIIKAVIVLSMLFSAIPSAAENFTVKGAMDSAIHYELQHQITAGDSMKKLMLSFVVPESFDSPTYKQQISNFKIAFIAGSPGKKHHHGCTRQQDHRGDLDFSSLRPLTL